MPKNALRRSLLDRRRILAPVACDEAGRIIQKFFIESSIFAQAHVIGLYAPIDNEVDTAGVMQAALQAGKTVLYPAVEKGTMFFRAITAPDELEKGAYGILQPRKFCPVWNPVDIDALVIPGIAFDRYGNRVGYGKGYYDRTLHPFENRGKFCGFCYDFQLVDKIVGEAHDVKMDRIITERGIIEVSTGLHR